MITVLYISSSDSLDGAARSLWNLLEAVNGSVRPIVLCFNEGEVYDFLINHGIECYVCPHLLVFGLPRKWSYYLIHPWRLRCIKGIRFFFRAAQIIHRKLFDTQIDIIHTNSSATVFGFRLSQFFKIPHIWHIRENREKGTYWGGNMFVEMNRLKRFINQADARIMVSNSCRKFWRGLKQQNTWTLMDAVCSANDCCYYRDKQPYFLFCANKVMGSKGLSTAITSFGMSGLFRTSNKDSFIRLKVIGRIDDDYKKEMITLAERYTCADHIDFLPPQEDVKSYFAHAIAFVNPSINEGLGRTTAEAMFWGCPVIAFASGGSIDLIQHRETGYLFNTVEECAELMKETYNNNQVDIILRAQEFAKQNLSIETFRQKIIAIYDSVLESKQ